MTEIQTTAAGNGSLSAVKQGRFYWFKKKAADGFKNHLKRHKIRLFLTIALVFLVLFLSRAMWQPGILFFRVNSHYIFFGLLFYFLCSWSIKKAKKKKYRFGIPLFCLLLTASYFSAKNYGEFDAHEYVKLWRTYNSSNFVELDEMPLTDPKHERIYPLRSIYNLAKSKTDENEVRTEPDLVRIAGESRWTMGVESAYKYGKYIGKTNKIFNLPATTPSISFSGANLIKVNFETGEHLSFGKNIFTNIRKRFGIWQFLNCEPADAKHVKNDQGEIVQMVNLIRWRGIIFPRPEFGGVYIISQSKEREGIKAAVKRTIFGSGSLIKVEELKNHKFLIGQNSAPYAVSRFYANSLRFQSGFFAPMPYYHKGDIRIADLKEDINPQPFTVYFIFKDEVNSKLYHYFALEPYAKENQGLHTSLLIPADGLGKMFVCRHHEKDIRLTGVSALTPKIVGSRKNYDWSRFKPVEYRPYIREINGKVRFFMLTTIVTNENPEDDTESEHEFVSDSTPEIVITDIEIDRPVWVDTNNPESWDRQIEKELISSWSGKK